MNGITQSYDCDNVTVGGGHFSSDISFSPSNITVGGGHDQYNQTDYSNVYVVGRTETAYNRVSPKSNTTTQANLNKCILGQIKTVNSESESRAWSEHMERCERDNKVCLEGLKDVGLGLGKAFSGDLPGAMSHIIDSGIQIGQLFFNKFGDMRDDISGLFSGQGTITGIPDRDK